MGGALIIGVFERLGFHLCKKLLEMGYEVGGISLNPAPDVTEEDMELEIGRNSNFVKVPLDGDDLHLEKDKAIIFSLYDLYTEGKTPQTGTERLGEKLEALVRLNYHWKSVVLLLPNGLGRGNREAGSIEAIRKAADLAESTAEKVLHVFLPVPGTPRTILVQPGNNNTSETAGRPCGTGDGVPDWEEAADHIALLIDKGETGIRTLEGIYPTLNGR
ncbi:hypothetical protein [Bacillus sp. FJAT-27245]|uniref:hypothetical protein n=1 Tax=Bacillus sp. FJAT-27245 TaxID=1684144 RepID=UPI0006A76920|nr:hypothetical protein [Bacillus sp. FJAT-27245]